MPLAATNFVKNPSNAKAMMSRPAHYITAQDGDRAVEMLRKEVPTMTNHCLTMAHLFPVVRELHWGVDGRGMPIKRELKYGNQCNAVALLTRGEVSSVDCPAATRSIFPITVVAPMHRQERLFVGACADCLWNSKAKQCPLRMGFEAAGGLTWSGRYAAALAHSGGVRVVIDLGMEGEPAQKYELDWPDHELPARSSGSCRQGPLHTIDKPGGRPVSSESFGANSSAKSQLTPRRKRTDVAQKSIPRNSTRRFKPSHPDVNIESTERMFGNEAPRHSLLAYYVNSSDSNMVVQPGAPVNAQTTKNSDNRAGIGAHGVDKSNTHSVGHAAGFDKGRNSDDDDTVSLMGTKIPRVRPVSLEPFPRGKPAISLYRGILQRCADANDPIRIANNKQLKDFGSFSEADSGRRFKKGEPMGHRMKFPVPLSKMNDIKELLLVRHDLVFFKTIIDGAVGQMLKEGAQGDSEAMGWNKITSDASRP
ncbi:hypothetical protein BO71DRAFT_458516 [Aspergillus ellipticus CBS 707.79]|uniref:Uncharacterized protein n=1 Tax=Aspergillus ellipticus CBS 707.79 TaxID=1448320 RepID=A0A319D4L6_9EURO|nr:hypothetical protein BO71DRAFT_458516 [Aspergillus ellipticus CBS 707.79]